jgi:hypothetical protein
VDIAVQKKVDLTLPVIDALVALTEEIADHLRVQRLTTFPDARCTGVETSPVYAPEHLEELRQFTSVLTATYSLWR